MPLPVNESATYTPEQMAQDNAEALANVPDLQYIPNFFTEEEQDAVWNHMIKFVDIRADAKERQRVSGAGEFSMPYRQKVYEAFGWFPERCYGNYYNVGDYASPHIDNSVLSENEQCIVSIKAGGTVHWCHVDNQSKIYRLHVAPGSAYHYKNDSRYVWLHGLPRAEAPRISLVFNYGGALLTHHLLDSENTYDWGKIFSLCESELGFNFFEVRAMIDLCAVDLIMIHRELIDMRRARLRTLEESRYTLSLLKQVIDLFNSHNGADKTPREAFVELWTRITNDERAFHPVNNTGYYRNYPLPTPASPKVISPALQV